MVKMFEEYLQFLKSHSESVIRWKINQGLMGNKPSLAETKNFIEYRDTSQVIRGLLSTQRSDGSSMYHPYDKWFGSHWGLSILADLSYPAGDLSLKPLLEQCYGWLLSKDHQNNIRTINGRVRRCASQEGNCVFYSLALGIADERTEELAARLIKWQWEDGGWNCDKRPNAAVSSFNETLIPLRGLAWYSKSTGDPKAKHAVDRAAELFLKRHLIWRLTDGSIIDPNFLILHYPNYWHYDILFALQVMSEAGYIQDSRCMESLDLLESKWLSDGGFPAEGKYYRVDEKKLSGHSKVDWGGTSKIHSNPYVSMNAFIVLKHSGRLVM
jgi:hypothetical protein